ncbi:MAG: ATP synthase F1 subunit gamma [Bacteroidia bacterium]|nr:ATP synthase F1 subunit gamma [Bacteroidia bacterium]
MANLKEVRVRITSVSSTQQITKAMKLVSATKLRKAQNAIVQMRPYAQMLQNLLLNLADSIEGDSLASYFNARPVNNVLLVVITSDRGLCGGFNANVVKQTNALLREKYAAQAAKGNVTILPVGKKGFEFFGRMNAKMVNDFRETFQNLNAENGFAIAEWVLDAFRKKQFDAIEIVYNKFKNAGTQILTAEPFLPIDMNSFAGKSSKTKSDYIFEPGKTEILEELIPRILKTTLYRTLLDSHASEHGARMVAMDKATDNAGELLKSLRLQYNRARQAAITNEISEIVGGAAALG